MIKIHIFYLHHNIITNGRKRTVTTRLGYQTTIRHKRSFNQASQKSMYSDFASPLTFPVTELTNKLNNLGYQDMVKKAVKGDYDYDE